MKKGIVLVFICSILGCYAQEKKSNFMKEVTVIQETVSKLFISSDNSNWDEVEDLFASKVTLDYSSMNGNPATVLEPSQITDAWKTVLPGFKYTHHQLGNFITKQDQDKAHVYCYGTATHYLEDKGGNIWTVVGSYDIDLKKEEHKWQVTAMKFNFKYQDGNTTLVQKAIENAKQ
ncbi:nuclear transport factor 2 family protein [Aquimarina rhabdastrellae]